MFHYQPALRLQNGTVKNGFRDLMEVFQIIRRIGKNEIEALETSGDKLKTVGLLDGKIVHFKLTGSLLDPFGAVSVLIHGHHLPAAP